MTTFHHDGIDLFFTESGHGELLIALHGGLGLDHTYLRPWLDPLAEDRRLAYPDLRANGRSEGDGVGMTMPQLADDVDALRAHLGAPTTWLLGHSYGGFVALQYALDHADSLAGLVLADTDSAPPSAETMGRELTRLGADLDQVMSAFEQPVETTADLHRLFHVVGPYYLPHSAPDTARTAMAELIFRPEGSAGGDAALADWDVTDRLAEIDVPALVVAGADDFLFPPDRAERLGAGLPDARVVVIDQAGHLPMIEQQGAFLDAVRGFVGAGGPRQ